MFKVNAKQALDYLEKNALTQEEHLRLLGILNRSINSFPLQDPIEVMMDGSYVLNGQKMTIEEVVKFRQGISALKDNWAFQILGDKILFDAIKQGVHFAETPEKMMFSKTAIWFITKFRQFITSFDVPN